MTFFMLYITRIRWHRPIRAATRIILDHRLLPRRTRPATTRMLNDLSWLTFVMVFPAYVVQMLCIALASFMDRTTQPLWPRWVGYLNLWVALGGTGGGIAAFFKTGPFAWDGVTGFYIPIIAFVISIAVMTYYMHTGITRQFAREYADAGCGDYYEVAHES